MRQGDLWRRIAEAPRGVVLALLGAFALLSPGLLALRAPEPASARSGAALLVLELRCRDGVFAPECLRSALGLGAALESRRELVERVDSLAQALLPRALGGELALVPLLARAPADEAEARALRARLREEPELRRRLFAADEHATRLSAWLVPGASERAASELVASLRARFADTAGLELRVVAGPGAGPAPRGSAGSAGALVLALCVAALCAASAFARLAGLAPLALCGLALLGFAAGVARLVGAERTAALWAAGLFALPALAAAHARLLARLAVERTGGTAPERAFAAALSGLGPALALSFGAAFGAGVALLTCTGGVARALAAAAFALGAGLALQPLALAAALPWISLGATRAARRRLGAALDLGIERARSRADAWLRGKPRRARALGAGLLALALGGVALLDAESGTPAAQRLEIDAGAPGAALAPALLEHVLALQRALEAEPGVASASSLVDLALLPAMRAEHGGDPGFAVVPPLQADVARIAHTWQRAAPAALDGVVDAERRRLFVTWLALPDTAAQAALEPRVRELARAHLAQSGARLLADGAPPSASAGGRARAGVLGLAALVVALAGFGAWLRSARAALACALPAALGAALPLALLGLGPFDLDPELLAAPALALVACADGAAALAARARELAAAGVDPRLAVSLAARQSGPTLGRDTLAGAALALAALLAPAPLRELAFVAGASRALAAGLSLVALPALLRGLPRGWLVARSAERAVVGIARTH